MHGKIRDTKHVNKQLSRLVSKYHELRGLVAFLAGKIFQNYSWAIANVRDYSQNIVEPIWMAKIMAPNI